MVFFLMFLSCFSLKKEQKDKGIFTTAESILNRAKDAFIDNGFALIDNILKRYHARCTKLKDYTIHKNNLFALVLSYPETTKITINPSPEAATITKRSNIEIAELWIIHFTWKEYEEDGLIKTKWEYRNRVKIEDMVNTLEAIKLEINDDRIFVSYFTETIRSLAAEEVENEDDESEDIENEEQNINSDMIDEADNNDENEEQNINNDPINENSNHDSEEESEDNEDEDNSQDSFPSTFRTLAASVFSPLSFENMEEDEILMGILDREDTSILDLIKSRIGNTTFAIDRGEIITEQAHHHLPENDQNVVYRKYLITSQAKASLIEIVKSNDEDRIRWDILHPYPFNPDESDDADRYVERLKVKPTFYYRLLPEDFVFTISQSGFREEQSNQENITARREFHPISLNSETILEEVSEDEYQESQEYQNLGEEREQSESVNNQNSFYRVFDEEVEEIEAEPNPNRGNDSDSGSD